MPPCFGIFQYACSTKQSCSIYYLTNLYVTSRDVPVSVVLAFFVSIDVGIGHCHDTSIGIGIGLYHEYLVSVSTNQKISLNCGYWYFGLFEHQRFPCVQIKRVSNNYDIARQNNEAEEDGA